MRNLLWMLEDADRSLLDTSDFTSLWNQVTPILTTIVWIMVAILGLVLIVKGITTALAIVKAADEPQVRQEKIASFKYMAIGVGIALVITTLMGTLLTIFGKAGGVEDATGAE